MVIDLKPSPAKNRLYGVKKGKNGIEHALHL
jgi:hypothetical protein